MPLEDDLCDILKKARQGQRLTVEQVADRSGLATGVITELERGRKPDRKEIEAVAEALGLKARPLVDHALEGWQPAPVGSMAGLETIHGDIGGYAVKGYIVYDTHTRQAAIVDTGYNAVRMVELLRRHRLQLQAICLTHGHVDHAGGLDQILAFAEAPVYIGAEDLALLQWQPRAALLRALSGTEDAQTIGVGALQMQVMVTPGHTPGGLCYRVRLDGRELCFVGDTLFAGSIGRANPFSLYPRHLESVREGLMTLPSDAALLPGHGPATTVAEERVHNPFAVA